ncbi:MAG: hypothetical protein MUC92_12785 [Fimbriimonadaceae bacterium]|nr:hypothetical protein [Fimbriimonadaceae bacterium]
MPQRLMGVRGYVSADSDRGATVKVVRVHDGVLIGKILSMTPSPPLGSIELVAFSGTTYVRLTGNSSLMGEEMMSIRPLEQPQLIPQSHSVKTLVQPLAGVLVAGDIKTPVKILAASQTAFSFFSDSAPPAGNTLQLLFRIDQQPVNIEVRMKELHREKERYRGTAAVFRSDRITTGRLEQYLRETA